MWVVYKADTEFYSSNNLIQQNEPNQPSLNNKYEILTLLIATM
jgi:hypothetical protein